MKNALGAVQRALLRIPAKVFTGVFIAACIAFVGYTGYVIYDLYQTNSNLVDRINAMANGDLNEDGKIDIKDVSILSSHWSGKPAKPQVQGDLNGDGKVDGLDLSILLQNWSPELYYTKPPQADIKVPQPTVMQEPIIYSL